MRLEDLRVAIGSRYRDYGLPGWRDPHPSRSSPAADEYSRVTDPERYRLVHVRARAWVDTLRSIDGVVTEEVEPKDRAEVAAQTAHVERGVRISSDRPGTLALLLLERDVPLVQSPGTLAVLTISVEVPDVVVTQVPDCGCDACDSGSDDLLTTIDDAIGSIVEGPFVALLGEGWFAHWSPSGARSGASRPARTPPEVNELCRRLSEGDEVTLPAQTRAHVGRSWLA